MIPFYLFASSSVYTAATPVLIFYRSKTGKAHIFQICYSQHSSFFNPFNITLRPRALPQAVTLRPVFRRYMVRISAEAPIILKLLSPFKETAVEHLKLGRILSRLPIHSDLWAASLNKLEMNLQTNHHPQEVYSL